LRAAKIPIAALSQRFSTLQMFGILIFDKLEFVCYLLPASRQAGLLFGAFPTVSFSFSQIGSDLAHFH
jgi:hypothetical protein